MLSGFCLSAIAVFLVGCSSSSPAPAPVHLEEARRPAAAVFGYVPLPPDIACARLHDAGCAIGVAPDGGVATDCVARLEFADARRPPGVPSVFEAMARVGKVEEVPVKFDAHLVTVMDDGRVLCRGIR